MTDGQKGAAAWLQNNGWTVVMTDTGFTAVHGYEAMAMIATERKTNIAWTPNAATFRSEVRKTATVGVIVELIATVTNTKPAEVA
jgi:uncharacterized membrane protein